MSSDFSPNRLLSALSARDLALLTPHLTRVPLALRQHVEAPQQPIKQIYFVESGIVSIVAGSSERESIEVGLTGCEGVTGIPVIMGNHIAIHEAFVQLEGAALRIETTVLREVMAESKAINDLLLRYVHVFNIQVAHTALANGRAKIEERLARWLLMVHDRTAGDEAAMTHDFISVMLGVRRPGVTDAIHGIEGKGLIRSTRGAVRIVDREGLAALAGGIYGVPEQEFRRLIG